MHLETVQEFNEIRDVINTDVETMNWKSTLDIVSYYNARRGQWANDKPLLAHDLAILKGWQGDEGIRIVEARMSILVPKLENTSEGHPCNLGKFWYSVNLICVLTCTIY